MTKEKRKKRRTEEKKIMNEKAQRDKQVITSIPQIAHFSIFATNSLSWAFWQPYYSIDNPLELRLRKSFPKILALRFGPLKGFNLLLLDYLYSQITICEYTTP